MIAVDTNILVYAHREDMPQHRSAREALESLVDRGRAWALPWPCLHEFLAVTTHPRLFDPPSPVPAALEAMADLVAAPGLTLLGETHDHVEVLTRLLQTSGAVGPKVHDARIAAICLCHDVTQLWTADRDFSYFPQLETHNPLTTPTG